MMEIVINTEALSENNRTFFVEMLPYVSTHIETIRKEGTDVFATVSDEAYADEVKEKSENLKEMITGGKLGGKEIPIKTLVDFTSNDVLNRDPVFETLLEQESVIQIQDGIYAYSGIVLKLMNYFSAKISEFGLTHFKGVKEHEYPVLYPIRDFEKGKYFETFPHYIMFQTVMKNDLEVLNRFAQNGTKDSDIFQEMKTPRNVLRNAACVPVYELLENQMISPDKPKTFIVLGKCFRNESENVFELARLNEFTMKEFVFVGTPEQCKAGIEKSKELWKFWVECFGLNCKVDTANDSFFASNYQKLKLFQVLGDSKQEFRWYVPSSNSYIACSSANFHRTHFTKPYQIKNDQGTFCNSACFAFGMERMVYALLSQKGVDPKQWDKATYEEISSYVKLD